LGCCVGVSAVSDAHYCSTHMIVAVIK